MLPEGFGRAAVRAMTMGDDTPVVTSLVLPILIRPILSQVGGLWGRGGGGADWLPEEKVVRTGFSVGGCFDFSLY